METDDIKALLWDLKYQRHLQKAHTIFNTLVTLSIGFVAIILAMKETEILILPRITTFYLSILLGLSPWVGVLVLKKERDARKSIVKWIQHLDKTEYFNKTEKHNTSLGL